MWITKRCTADSLYCSVNPMCINKWVIVVFAGIDGGQRSRHRWQFLSFSSCIVIMLVKRLTIDITLYSRILQYSRNLLAYQTRTFLSILFFSHFINGVLRWSNFLSIFFSSRISQSFFFCLVLLCCFVHSVFWDNCDNVFLSIDCMRNANIFLTS